MARVPWVEQAWGQDALARTHRLVGFTSFTLLMAHIVLITLGVAASSPTGLWGTIVDLVVEYPGMLLAVAGTLALVMVVVTSVRRARRRLRYESWHLIHLYGYLGAGLVLPHQLWTGAEFLDSTAATVFWWSLWATAAGAVLVFRLGVPLWRSLSAPLRVLDVRHDGPGVTTVTLGGPGVARIPARAGQFFQWRFLDGPGWTRANPYSLSAAPDGRTLRITAAHAGDGSARLAALAPGTRVLLEGPYGRLHEGVRTRRKVLLMGSGIGITPLRALLEDLDQSPGDVTVIHRVHAAADAVLADELAALAPPVAPATSSSRAPASTTGRAGCPGRPGTSATRRPCSTSSPTSPTTTCSSAGPRAGWRRCAPPPSRPGSTPRPSTSSASATDPSSHDRSPRCDASPSGSPAPSRRSSSSSATTPRRTPRPARASSPSPGPARPAGSGPTSGSTAAPPDAASAGTTYAGDAVSTRYGDVQVEITVATARSPRRASCRCLGNHRDQEINAAAVPILNEEAVAAQDADIDMVSGATYTSEGYVGSLQSALDRAGL